MSAIDYSKWDKLEVSSDEEGDAQRTEPAVYKVEGDSITIPGRNVTLHTRSQEKQATSVVDTSSADTSVSSAALATKTQRKRTENGAELEAYSWSQTESTITVSFVVDPSAKAGDVALDIASSGVVNVAVKEWSFEGELYGPIGELEAEEDLDWTLITEDGKRWLRIELPKRDLGAGVLWWRCAFKGHPEIDVNTTLGTRSASRKKNAQAFADSWAKAHEMFLERAKTRDKVVVDTSD
eukprot:m.362557 g.362557  ORF g.362557 m.362557 type:complete len:238 (-) comp20629_c0_seq1:352-1065(-)